MAIRKDIISSFQTREVGSERPHLPPVSQNRSAPRGAPHLTSEEGRKTGNSIQLKKHLLKCHGLGIQRRQSLILKEPTVPCRSQQRRPGECRTVHSLGSAANKQLKSPNNCSPQRPIVFCAFMLDNVKTIPGSRAKVVG